MLSMLENVRSAKQKSTRFFPARSQAGIPPIEMP